MCKEIHSVGISRTPRWNARNGGHELANHPLRAALISNYLIKICLRRGAPHAPFDVFFDFLSSPPPREAKKRRGRRRGEDFQRGVEGRSDSPTWALPFETKRTKTRANSSICAEFVIYHCSNYNHRPLSNSRLSNASNLHPPVHRSFDTNASRYPDFYQTAIDAN